MIVDKKRLLGLGLFILVVGLFIGYRINGFLNWRPTAPDSKYQPHPPEPFPYTYQDSIGSLVSAKGTWESNLKLAYPYSMSAIDCWHNMNICIESDANTQDSDLTGNEMINVDNNYFDIQQWDNQVIVASSSGLCTKTVLTVDRINKQITELSTPINISDEFCKKFGGNEVQTTVLIDGSNKWIKEFVGKK